MKKNDYVLRLKYDPKKWDNIKINPPRLKMSISNSIIGENQTQQKLQIPFLSHTKRNEIQIIAKNGEIKRKSFESLRNSTCP